MVRLAWVVGLAISAWGSGCGNSSPCEDYGSEVCSRACECTGNETCAVVTGGGDAILSFESEADCRYFFSSPDACEARPTIDYESCASRLEDAMCVDVDNGEGRALDHPDC